MFFLLCSILSLMKTMLYPKSAFMGCWCLCYFPSSSLWSLTFHSGKGERSWTYWWCTPVVPTLGRWTQEDQKKCKYILSYIVRLRRPGPYEAFSPKNKQQQMCSSEKIVKALPLFIRCQEQATGAQVTFHLKPCGYAF